MKLVLIPELARTVRINTAMALEFTYTSDLIHHDAPSELLLNGELLKLDEIQALIYL